jgi:hypothetical protein
VAKFIFSGSKKATRNASAPEIQGMTQLMNPTVTEYSDKHTAQAAQAAGFFFRL